MDPNELPRIAYDPSTLEAFYREHVEAVERFVVRRVGDPYLAADLTADVFLAGIDAAASYRPERGAPAAWLFGVALDDLSVTEAANALGLRPVTARVHLHRARAALRRQILDDDSPAISYPLEAS